MLFIHLISFGVSCRFLANINQRDVCFLSNIKALNDTSFFSVRKKVDNDNNTYNWSKSNLFVCHVCQRLQAERRSFSTYRTTVDELFQMFPPSPDLIKPSPDRCRTCAVVGNSGRLKGSHYGPLIDFQDFVIR